MIADRKGEKENFEQLENSIWMELEKCNQTHRVRKNLVEIEAIRTTNAQLIMKKTARENGIGEKKSNQREKLVKQLNVMRKLFEYFSHYLA